MPIAADNESHHFDVRDFVSIAATHESHESHHFEGTDFVMIAAD